MRNMALFMFVLSEDWSALLEL
uniref:Uncharacterized protein n=1 Tax=Tetranychus urticae TaxID=32264 RepID=T1KT65_TETUR